MEKLCGIFAILLASSAVAVSICLLEKMIHRPEKEDSSSRRLAPHHQSVSSDLESFLNANEISDNLEGLQRMEELTKKFRKRLAYGWE